MPESWWGNAIFSLVPTIVLGLIFWMVMRMIIKGDRTARREYDRIEAEERARLGLPPKGSPTAAPVGEAVAELHHHADGEAGEDEGPHDAGPIRPQESQKACERPHFTKDSVGPMHGLRPPHSGLCDRCRHQRVVTTTRGSAFSLCEKSKEDPRFPKYPRLPVVACPGFSRRGETVA